MMLTLALVCPESPSELVTDRLRTIPSLRNEIIANGFGDHEVIVVTARTMPDALRAAIERLDNAKGFCLLEGDTDAMLVEAIRRATGDYVFVADARNPRLDILRCALTRLSEGDVIHLGSAEGIQYPFNSRIISRRVAKSVLNSRDPAQAFHGLNHRDAFVHVQHAAPSVRRGFGKGIVHAVRTRWRATFSSRILPLRIVSVLAFFGAGANLLYSAYVLLVYFLKAQVMEGWTTLSLQQSGMALLFSMAIVVAAEYVINAIRRDRRSIVIEEVRSNRRLFDQRNVEAIEA